MNKQDYKVLKSMLRARYKQLGSYDKQEPFMSSIINMLLDAQILPVGHISSTVFDRESKDQLRKRYPWEGKRTISGPWTKLP